MDLFLAYGMPRRRVSQDAWMGTIVQKLVASPAYTLILENPAWYLSGLHLPDWEEDSARPL